MRESCGDDMHGYDTGGTSQGVQPVDLLGISVENFSLASMLEQGKKKALRIVTNFLSRTEGGDTFFVRG